MAKIILRYQNETQSEFELQQGMNSIGRLPNHDICIDNLGVSRSHAFILGDKEQSIFIIEDLESLNGTYVNKRRIRKWMLRANDVITIGQHTLEFVIEDSSRKLPNFTGKEPHLLDLRTNKVFPLVKEVLYFGNSSSDDIPVPGLMVGKHFASLNRNGNRWTLHVLVKRFAHARVNGKDVQEADLFPGDELEVAGERFEFRIP